MHVMLVGRLIGVSYVALHSETSATILSVPSLFSWQAWIACVVVSVAASVCVANATPVAPRKTAATTSP